MEDNKTPLLPCPFCNGEAKVTYISTLQAVVGCSTPSCRGNIEYSPAWLLDDFAVAGWQRRDPKPIPYNFIDVVIEHLEQIANGQRTQAGIEATLLMVKANYRNLKETGTLYR